MLFTILAIFSRGFYILYNIAKQYQAYILVVRPLHSQPAMLK